MDTEVDHIDIRVYGPRNYLLGQARIPATLIPGFRPLLAHARTINPIYDAGLMVRWMIKTGYKTVVSSLKRGRVEAHPGS